MPNPLPPPSTLPWYAQWWVPAVLVGGCIVYLSVLAGGYVTAAAEPTLPAPRAQRPPAAPAAAPEPARLVAAPAPVRKRPKPKPKPAPVRVVPVAASVTVTPVQSRAMAKAISRSATALSRVSEAISWSPYGSASTSTWALPVATYRLTARFGDHGRHWASTHTGLDFAAPTGTPVGAVDAGVVVSTGWNGAYGQQVAVRHADGTETSYSHLSSIGVARGATVARGQLLGRVGATGNVTGPHLHLEVRPGGGEPVDPAVALRAHGVPIS